MAKKIKVVKKIKITPESIGEVQSTEPLVPIKTRLQELQELYAILLKEGITSISKLEAMISQLQK